MTSETVRVEGEQLSNECRGSWTSTSLRREERLAVMVEVASLHDRLRLDSFLRLSSPSVGCVASQPSTDSSLFRISYLMDAGLRYMASLDLYRGLSH